MTKSLLQGNISVVEITLAFKDHHICYPDRDFRSWQPGGPQSNLCGQGQTV